MPEYVESINNRFKGVSAEDRIGIIHKLFPESIAMTTSFGRDSAIMLNLVTSAQPDMPVIYIDHGCWQDPQAQEDFVRNCIHKFNLNLFTFRPRAPLTYSQIYDVITRDEDVDRIARELKPLSDRGKVEPMERALKYLNLKAWMSGISRDESEARKDFQFASKHGCVYKIHPILDWTAAQRQEYLQTHNLPINHSYFDPFKGIAQKGACGLHPEECRTQGEGI